MHLAKRACISYLRCVYLMKDKEVFKFKEISAEKLANSLGLATTPNINFNVEDGEVPITNTMSRAEQRAARIQMLRIQAKERKAQKKQQIWDQVSEGESLGDSDSQLGSVDEKSHEEEEQVASDSDEDVMV